MESEEKAVARVRAAEEVLNNAIRRLHKHLQVEIDSVPISEMLDAPARNIVAIRIIKEL